MNNNLQILIVDDDKEDSHMMQYSMKEAGVTNPVRFIFDASEMLDYMRSADPRSLPGIILLDLNMPKVSGHDILIALKGNSDWRKVPVIIFSTSNFENDVTRAYAAGAAGYIVKPVQYERFVSMIRMLGNYWFDCVVLPHI